MLDTCPYCGGSITFVERALEATDSGHHNAVYYCRNCNVEVLSR